MAGKDQVIIDLTSYKDRVGSRVAQGRYRVLVEDAEQDTSKAGNEMIILSLRVIGGDYDGETIVDRLTLTEKAMFRVVAFMKAIGLPTPKKRLNVQLKTWIGKTLEIDVEDGEPYNGQVKSEVRGYMKIMKKSSDTRTDIRAVKDPTDDIDRKPPGHLGGLAEFAEQGSPDAEQDTSKVGTSRSKAEESILAQPSEFAERANSLGAATADPWAGTDVAEADGVPDVVDLDDLEL